PPRGAYSAFDVNHTQNSVQQFLQKNGYFQAQVHPELQIDKVHGLVNVNFHVALGRHAKYGRVVFKGAPSEVEPTLQRALRSWRGRVQGIAIRSGKSYSFHALQKAPQFLETRLVGQHYLGSRVQLANAEYDPSTNRADLFFDVTLGQRVQVSIQGAHVWSWSRRKLLPIYEQSGLDPE